MWEKLRFVYIAIVGTYSLIVFSVTLYLGLTTLIMFLRIALVGGIFSNFCFCAGPLIAFAAGGTEKPGTAADEASH